MQSDIAIPRASQSELGLMAVFYGGFVALWTLFVLAIWRLDLLPDPARHWFRTFFWVGACIVWVVWKRPAIPMKWLGLWPVSPKQAGIGAAAFLLLLGWNFLRVHYLSQPLGRLGSTTPVAVAWSFIGVFVEELLFRGVIQTKMAEHSSFNVAISVSAMSFLLIHVPGWIILSIPVSAILVATVFLVGVICGFLRQTSKSLWPAIAAHWANNLGAML